MQLLHWWCLRPSRYLWRISHCPSPPQLLPDSDAQLPSTPSTSVVVEKYEMLLILEDIQQELTRHSTPLKANHLPYLASPCLSSSLPLYLSLLYILDTRLHNSECFLSHKHRRNGEDIPVWHVDRRRYLGKWSTQSCCQLKM